MKPAHPQDNRRRLQGAGRVPVVPESTDPAAFRLEGVDGEGIIMATTGMADVVCAAANRTAVPGVDQIEHQRRVDTDGRV